MDRKLVVTKSRREDIPVGKLTDQVKHTVTKGLCLNDVVGCDEANTQPAGRVTQNLLHEKMRVGMEG